MGLSALATRSSQLLDLIYPPRCFACSEETDQPHGLCGSCWQDTTFISGTVCETCGVPLPGDTEPFTCDACLTYPPPWSKGRAVMLYEGSGKRIVLSFKHSDRTDMAKPLGIWLERAAGDLLENTDLFAPIPLHWHRLFQRGFNQSALLAKRVSRLTNIPVIPDLLQRNRATKPQSGNRQERFENQKNSLSIPGRHINKIQGKSITLVDDVLTTGATLSAATSQLQDAGAASVQILVLARVAREPG